MANQKTAPIKVIAGFIIMNLMITFIVVAFLFSASSSTSQLNVTQQQVYTGIMQSNFSQGYNQVNATTRAWNFGGLSTIGASKDNTIFDIFATLFNFAGTFGMFFGLLACSTFAPFLMGTLIATYMPSDPLGILLVMIFAIALQIAEFVAVYKVISNNRGYS